LEHHEHRQAHRVGDLPDRARPHPVGDDRRGVLGDRPAGVGRGLLGGAGVVQDLQPKRSAAGRRCVELLNGQARAAFGELPDPPLRGQWRGHHHQRAVAGRAGRTDRMRTGRAGRCQAQQRRCGRQPPPGARLSDAHAADRQEVKV